MVKFIIDVDTEFVPDILLSYEDSILIINEKCFVNDNQIKTLKYINEIKEEWPSGLLYVRTDSELFKGILIGNIMKKFPNVSLLSKNPDRFKFNIPNLLHFNNSHDISLTHNQDFHIPENLVLIPKSQQKNPKELIKIVKKPYTDKEVFESVPPAQRSSDKIIRGCKPSQLALSQHNRIAGPYMHLSRFERPAATFQQKSNDLVINSQIHQPNSDLIRAPSVKFLFNPESKSFSSNHCQKSLLLNMIPDTSIKDPLKSILTIKTLSSISTFHELFLVVSQTIKIESCISNTLDQVKSLITVLFDRKIFTFSASNIILEEFFQKSDFWNTSINYNKFNNPFHYG